jgi:segregation and condensation protein A
LAQGEQEDPRSELVRRLEEYQRFKQIAEELKVKEGQRQDLFQRVVDQEKLDQLKEDSQEVFIEASLFDLINALSAALKSVPEKEDYEVDGEEYTIEQKIHSILHLLMEKPRLSLMELFSQSKHKVEVICTFVAVLELIRLKEVIAIQSRQFEDIEIARNIEHEQPGPQDQESNQAQN